MAERIRKEKAAPPKKKEEEHVEPKAEAADTTDIDALLDEIDAVLEENAQDFVDAFIQQGGE